MAAASLLLCSFFKYFFGLVSVIFLQCIANVTHRTFEIVQKNRDPANIGKMNNYYEDIYIRNYERRRRVRAPESRDFHVRGTESGPNDV